MTYIVHRNRDGGRFREREFGDFDAALAYAAELCGVSLRTMRGRAKDRVFSGGTMELSGRETGRDGVWIEEV